MTGQDVSIPFERMESLVRSLDEIMTEFSDASGHAADLREAIGAPQGRTELREAADDFEGRWNDRRETLRRELEDLRTRVDDTRESWVELDADLASQQEVAP